MNKKVYQSKTVWTGIVGLIGVASAYFTGEMALGTAIQTALTCLIGIFLRTGMMSNGLVI